MATIFKIEKMSYLSTYSSYFHNISFWTYVLEDDRSNGVMTLRFQGQLIAKIKIKRKKHVYTEYNLTKISHNVQQISRYVLEHDLHNELIT